MGLECQGGAGPEWKGVLGAGLRSQGGAGLGWVKGGKGGESGGELRLHESCAKVKVGDEPRLDWGKSGKELRLQETYAKDGC